MKERQQEIKSLLWKCLKWCHMALWNFRLHFEPSGLPPSNIHKDSHKWQTHINTNKNKINSKEHKDTFSRQIQTLDTHKLT